MNNKDFLRERVSIDSNGCWNWTLYIDPDGYGVFSRPKVERAAHRAAYKIFVGDIPEDHDVDHTCWNPSCCNPSHLRLLPRNENRRLQRSSFQSHCKNGHEMKGANVARYSNGRKACRTCANKRAREYQARKRGDAA